MPVLDLTRAIAGDAARVATETLRLASPGIAYDGVIHRFDLSSMAGTYIDFPGHIRQTDNGQRADTFPVEQHYRQPAEVIHLDIAEGPVDAAALAAAGARPASPALIINALGDREPDAIPSRSVYLTLDAVAWIVARGTRLLVSDVYESRQLDGVFYKLFAAGVATVCEPSGLRRLQGRRAFLTAAYPPIPEATQLPCRLIAEVE